MTVPSKSNVPSLWPWPLTYEGQLFQWIENNPISILYQFQIDISSSSREIKYQNIGRTCRTHTQTDRVKTRPRNPLRGRGNYILAILCRLVSQKIHLLAPIHMKGWPKLKLGQVGVSLNIAQNHSSSPWSSLLCNFVGKLWGFAKQYFFVICVPYWFRKVMFAFYQIPLWQPSWIFKMAAFRYLILPISQLLIDIE